MPMNRSNLTLQDAIAFCRWRYVIMIFALFVLASCESTGPRPTVVTPETTAPSAPSTLSELDQELYLQAISLIKENNPTKAEKILSKLKKKYGRHQGVLTNLATTYFKQKKNDQAKQVCTDAINSNTSIPEIHNILGLIAVEDKDFPKAEAEYLKAIKLNKNFANAHYNLALLYDIYFQDIPKAYTQYEKYLALMPDDGETKSWVDQLQYSLDRE